MTGHLLSMLETVFPLRALDAGEYARLKIRGMDFTLEAYEARGLGHVSVMNARGFCGLMRMQTLIVTPTERDMPLFSYDLVQAMGKNTLYLEMFDTLLAPAELEALSRLKQSSTHLPDHDPGKAWYEHLVMPQNIHKKGGRTCLPAMKKLTGAFAAAYIAAAKQAPVCDAAAKKEKSSAYAEGLLSHGGPAADVFKKALGEEKTGDVFRRVIFGTGR